MLRYLGVIITVFIACQSVFAQGVSGSHDVQPGSEPNEYHIKTTIKGLEGVDIARIKYIVDGKHTYKASPNNSLFSDRSETFIKFYIMAIPTTGVLTIELGILMADASAHTFPVEFQYSKNEEKQTVNLPAISLPGSEVIAAVVEEPEVTETPEPEAPPVVKEPEVTETPEPEAPPVVEEPEVTETPEPEAPPVVEEPEVIETPEPEAPPVKKEEPKPVSTPAVVNKVSTKYTVQLLSLSNFSQTRLNTYCRQHNLPVSKVKKRNVGAVVKITYGEVSSISEAKKLKDELARDYGINESFVTSIKN